MVTCIFCDNQNEAKSIEHIIPESFGNKDYLMDRSAVCDECNRRFAKFEDKALSNSIFVFERARLAVVTKKGKNVKGKVRELGVTGDKDFKYNQIIVTGVSGENFKNYNSDTGIGELYVETFDKSEVSAAKLALKIALEALYTSKKEIFDIYNFQELKDYLTNKNVKDWPFLMSDAEPLKFISIPRMTLKHRLKLKKMEIKIAELDDNILIFKFTFGAINLVINLNSRSVKWFSEFISIDPLTQIYPKHFRNKI